ncbi:hypothetical protein QEN19_004258 [Hanseniaspora menglaensis]
MRISYRIIQNSKKIDPLLPFMLPQCRTIQHANQELIWLKNHFQNSKSKLLKAVLQRYNGKPLQYILETQPFGDDLTIKCKLNVLIPRWETDDICNYINTKILKNYARTDKKVKIIDLCSGSGCVSLALKEKNPTFEIVGVDISDDCIQLATENKILNHLQDVQYIQGNVLRPSSSLMNVLTSEKDAKRVDMIVSNPPYVLHSTLPQLNVSVKKYEPSLALFGNLQFYENFVNVWSNHCDSFFYELGEEEQYLCVQNNLDSNVWSVFKWMDGNDKLRGVYGYRKNSNISKMFNI